MDLMTISNVLFGGGLGGRQTHNTFESARKLIKKSAMLIESWYSVFHDIALL